MHFQRSWYSIYSVEHFTRNEGVVSSSLIFGLSKKYRNFKGFPVFPEIAVFFFLRIWRYEIGITISFFYMVSLTKKTTIEDYHQINRFLTVHEYDPGWLL